MSPLLLEMNRAAACGAAALLNTLWYAAAVVGLAWIVLRWRPRINAATRYWIWTGVLVFLIVVPFVPGMIARARMAFAAREPTVAAAEPLARVDMPFAKVPRLALVTLAANRNDHPSRWPLWLLAAWIVAAGCELTRLARGLSSVRGLKRRAISGQNRDACSAAFVPAWRDCGSSPVVQSKAAGSNNGPCATKNALRSDAIPAVGMLPLRLRRRVQVLASTEITSPMAVGYRHPAVLMPGEMLTRLEEVEKRDVLLHEMAHLARYDDWLALVTHTLGAVLILHPLAAIVVRQIEREREIACDDFVVAHTGSVLSYARSLARLHDLRWSTGTRLLAPGILGRNSSLAGRIESLLQRGRKFSTRPSLGSLGVSIFLLFVLLAAGGFVPCWVAIAQTTVNETPKFEVASVKRSKPGTRGGELAFPPGRFIQTNAPVKTIIEWAYLKGPGFQLNPDQVKGGPSWINSERFDIDAKVPDSLANGEMKKLTEYQWAAQLRLMLQSLLVDRFKLKTHYETRELPIYALVVAKHGPKLTKSKLPPPGPGGSHPPGQGISMMRRGLIARGVTIGQLADALCISRELGRRVVVDQTGLKGLYDFTLKWTPEVDGGRSFGQSRAGEAAQTSGGVTPVSATPSTLGSSGPSIFTAIQQQLGLRLKPERGPVWVLVIDHIEQPTPN